MTDKEFDIIEDLIKPAQELMKTVAKVLPVDEEADARAAAYKAKRRGPLKLRPLNTCRVKYRKPEDDDKGDDAPTK